MRQSSQSYQLYRTSFRIRKSLNIALRCLARIVYHLTRSHLIITSRHPEPADITQTALGLWEYQKMIWTMFRSYIYEDIHLTSYLRVLIHHKYLRLLLKKAFKLRTSACNSVDLHCGIATATFFTTSLFLCLEVLIVPPSLYHPIVAFCNSAQMW